jgi:hypothetical protein
MRIKGELVALGVSAPCMVIGLVAVALARGWLAHGAGFAAVLGGSLALVSDRWRARLLGWAFAGLGLVALMVRLPA